MQNVDLSLSRNEFETLVKLAYLGNWVANAAREENEELAPYARLEQVVFKRAAEAGLTELVEYSDEHALYFPTDALEEAEAEHITDYDDAQFWEELPDRLAMRDMALKYSDKTVAAMDIDEAAEKAQPFMEKYWNEIEKHGLDRLKVA
jgi:hypothetical protein